MQTNTPNLPSWAESMVEPVARAIEEKLVDFFPEWDGDQRESIATILTNAALTEALPMVAEHFSGVARDYEWTEDRAWTEGDIILAQGAHEAAEEIATAIRREVGLI